jgi:hypothetical protein
MLAVVLQLYVWQLVSISIGEITCGAVCSRNQRSRPCTILHTVTMPGSELSVVVRVQSIYRAAATVPGHSYSWTENFYRVLCRAARSRPFKATTRCQGLSGGGGGGGSEGRMLVVEHAGGVGDEDVRAAPITRADRGPGRVEERPRGGLAGDVHPHGHGPRLGAATRRARRARRRATRSQARGSRVEVGEVRRNDAPDAPRRAGDDGHAPSQRLRSDGLRASGLRRRHQVRSQPFRRHPTAQNRSTPDGK